MSLRPLLKLNDKKQDIYLPNPYLYTAGQISKIKQYLPKTLSFGGIDAYQIDDELKQSLLKYKLKTKSINGIETASQNPLDFYNQKNLYLCEWNNLFVILDTPYNNKQDSQDQKDLLQDKLIKYLHDHLIFSNKKSKAVLDKTKETIVNPLEIQLELQPIQLEPQAFDNSVRKLRFICPVALILVKQENYSINRLAKIISEDLLNSIKIMIKNKLCIRIIRKSFGQGKYILLQSFVSKESEIEKQQTKLNQIINKVLIIAEQQNTDLSSGIQEIQNKQVKRELTNRQLIYILVGLFCIYIFLKINPLKQKQSQGL